MKTSEKIEATAEPENAEAADRAEEVKPRSVSELLSLDTYQGMTDIEIDSIIKFKASMLFESEENRLREQRNVAAANAIIETQTALLRNSTAVYKYLLENPPEFETIREEVADHGQEARQ